MKKPSQHERRPAPRVVPISRVASIAEEAVGQAGGAPRSAPEAASSARSAVAADPRDLVARALAILTEESVTGDEAQSSDLRRQRPALGNATKCPDLPPWQRVIGNAAQPLNLPLQRRMLSDGTEVPLPIRFFDAQCLLATFMTGLERAAEVLTGTGLQTVVQEDGNAIVLLGCFEYRKTDIGPYNEVCLGVWAVAPGDRIQACYVINLPVTTATANRAGREIWGYNKFVTPIDIQRDGKKFSTTLDDPDNALILMLEGTRGASVPMPPADVPTFSVLDGKVIKTVIRPMTPFQLSGGHDFVLKLGKSEHPMADNLRILGLDGARPALVQYADPLQSLLFPGGVL